jgi:hypothetical protein
MKIDSNKIELKKINENIYQILHDKNVLKFWSSPILVPFGLDNEYDKYIIRLELDENDSNKSGLNHEHLKKIFLHIEKIIKEKTNSKDNQFKSIIKKRENKKDLIECKIKTIKNSITTVIEYEDTTNNYLKTIFDLPKQSYVKILFEIYGLWDYRIEGKEENNKVGLILYANKIIVLK